MKKLNVTIIILVLGILMITTLTLISTEIGQIVTNALLFLLFCTIVKERSSNGEELKLKVGEKTKWAIIIFFTLLMGYAVSQYELFEKMSYLIQNTTYERYRAVSLEYGYDSEKSWDSFLELDPKDIKFADVFKNKATGLMSENEAKRENILRALKLMKKYVSFTFFLESQKGGRELICSTIDLAEGILQKYNLKDSFFESPEFQSFGGRIAKIKVDYNLP